MDRDEALRRARRRALRAAQAVTLGAALAMAPAAVGCGDDETSRHDDGVCPDGGTASDDRDCCEAFGGSWTEGLGCAVPGPFVPPDAPA